MMGHFKKTVSLILALISAFLVVGCFGTVSYTITVENGRISGQKNWFGKYEHDAFITVTAQAPDDNKTHFISWTVDGIVQSTSPTYSFRASQDANYVANYRVPEPGDAEFLARTELYRFYDDFSVGSADDPTKLDDTKWGYDEGGGGFGNNEIQYYTRNNIRLEDDTCIITMKKENMGNRNYTSGKFWSRGKFASTYGKIEAKIRILNKVLDADYTTEETQGIWPAFWMMPATSTYGGWPRSGEIDIMELRGRFPGQMNSTIHRRAQPNENGETWVKIGTGKIPGVEYSTGAHADDYLYPNGSDCGDWHVYTVEWEYANNELTFRYYVDDNLFFVIGESQWRAYSDAGELVKPQPFDKDFYIIFNFALGGTFDGSRVPSGTNNNIPDDARLFAQDAPPVEYEIDWVVWRDITPRG